MPSNPDRIALDRASARTIDKDGHLHVADSLISCATVNNYYGHEIPDFEALGLQPDKLYALLRDPVELERAASTFDGKPLMIVHRAQTAADHDRMSVVGTVNDFRWEAPNLRAALTVWDGEAIQGIESREQCDLSAGYRYKAVMTPGTFEGTRFDGRMTEIFGNHVALVVDGRVDGAVVGDSKPQEKTPMAQTAVRNRSALYAAGALRAYLRPKLAKDAVIDYGKIVAGVSKKTFKADRPRIKLAMDAATNGKFASDDATLSDIDELLDNLQEAVNELADDPEPTDEDETPEEKQIRMDKRAADKAAKDAAVDPDKDKDKKVDTITKPAMDAAIQSAVVKAQADVRAEMRAIQEAERAVRPFIGEIVVAQDTAAGVYKLALDLGGIKTEDVHPSAYAAMVAMLPLPGAAPTPGPRLAPDQASEEARFRAKYPGASRLIRS